MTTPRSQEEELGGAGRWPPGRRGVHIGAAEFCDVGEGMELKDKAPRGQGQEQSKGIADDGRRPWCACPLASGVSRDAFKSCSPRGRCVTSVPWPNVLQLVGLARLECRVNRIHRSGEKKVGET